MLFLGGNEMKMVNVKINGKYDILMPDHRAARPEWHTEDGWERQRIESMHDHLGKGDILYYVGAELGEMPALCQMWGAEVVLFEPNYKSWPVIKLVWDENHLKSPLRCFAGFASDVTQWIPPNPDKAIYQGVGWRHDLGGWPYYANGVIDPAHGFNQLYQEADGHPQVRIDDYIEKMGITPTAISLDVEGSEGRVLRGAVNLLTTKHPKIWLSGHSDFMRDQYNESLGDLRQWLKSLGYKEEFLDLAHEMHLYYSI